MLLCLQVKFDETALCVMLNKCYCKQTQIQCRMLANVNSAANYSVIVIVAAADVVCSMIFVEVHVVGIADGS